MTFSFAVVEALHGLLHPCPFDWRSVRRQRKIHINERHEGHAARILFKRLLEKSTYSSVRWLGVNRKFALFVQHSSAVSAFSFNRDALVSFARKELGIPFAAVINKIN